MLSDVDVLTLLLKLTEVLVETEVLLELLLADTEALIEADWLALTEIDAEFWLLDAEADALWLALTDAEVL